MAKKVIKATITRTKTAQSTHYTYPAVWLANKSAIQVICYETFSDEGVTDVTGRGDTDEIVYAYVDETLLPTLTADPNINEITRATAETEIPKYVKQINQIKDTSSTTVAIENILPALTKVRDGLVVTAGERQAVIDNLAVIDPDDATAGVNKTRGIVDILNDAGVT